MRWVFAPVRVTVSSVLAAGAIACSVATLAHCGGHEQQSASNFGDGGEGGAIDDGSEGGPVSYDDGRAPTQLLAVHASPGLFTFRLCVSSDYSAFAPNAVPWPYADAPDGSSSLAGISLGGGAAMPLELAPYPPFGGGSIALKAFLIDARVLAASANPNALCADLLGPQCPGRPSCLKASDYVTAVSDSWGAYAPAVFAVVGCATPGPGCGDVRGPFVKLVTLYDWMGPQPDQISVKLADVSLTTDAVVATLDTSDAGAVLLDAGDILGAPDRGATVTLPATPSSPEWDSRGVAIRPAADAGADGGAIATLRMSLADLQRVSDPSATPSSFFKGGGFYALVLIGDRGAPNPLYLDGGLNPAFDGRALHVIAIPAIP